MSDVIVLVGPTASGKSALAVELARRFDGEVISADSRQVYRGLDIGSGKITRREMKGVPHHLLDVADPKRTYTTHDFAKKANVAIDTILGRGKVPIICGGTGFYIDTLLGRIGVPDVPANHKLRARLAKKTPAQLFSLLQKRSPARAAHMDTPSERNNKIRLIRALEIAAAKRPKIPRPLTADSRLRTPLWIGITLPMAELEKKIRTRLASRMKAGMLAEARRLHADGLSWKRMESLGLEYRFLALLLQKKITRAQFDEQLFIEIRHYAKRQITYWKRNSDIRWSNPRDGASIARIVHRWLAR